MASISKTYPAFLLFILLLASVMQASAQDLQSPDWQVLLDDFGYTDLVTVTFPGITPHEVLTGDWAAAVRYDGIGTENGESMLLPPNFFRPDFTTNSTFMVVAPMTTFHDPANPVPGNNRGQCRILNEDLQIDVQVEMRFVPGGAAIGLNPGGVGLVEPMLSSPYVMFQTYRIKNIKGQALTNFELFQLLHTNPNDDLTEDNFGVYDPTMYPFGSLSDYRYDISTYGPALFTPVGSDLVGFSANTPPTAHSVGDYGSVMPPTGLLGEVLTDSLSGADFAGPTDITGALDYSFGNLAPGVTVSKTFLFWVAHGANIPPPPHDNVVLQAYNGDSNDASLEQKGYAGTGDDTISTVPGVLVIVPGNNWANFVRAAQKQVQYSLKNVTLLKQTPQIIQCADVFPAKTIGQQGTPNIRLRWPLMYEIPGTKWSLNIMYGTSVPFDDDGLAGPHGPTYFHTETWTWTMDATVESMKNTLVLFHELPFGLDKVPLISDEVLYPVLIDKLDSITADMVAGDMTGAGFKLGDFEMEVMDACIAVSPARPSPTGPGTGIANSLEHPACCKLLADAEYVGFNLGAFTTVK